MKKMLALLGLLFCGMPALAIENPLAVTVGDHTFTLPFKDVSATQLYSFKEGKGLPALQTIVYTYKSRVQVGFGAGPLVGTSNAVPFVSVEFLLPKKAFDPSVGPIWIGPWVGQQFKSATLGTPQVTLWGLDASIALW